MNIIDMLMPLTTTSIFSRICMVPSQTFLLVPLPTGDSPVAAWRTQHTIISIKLVSCLSSISVKFRKIKPPSKLHTFSKAIMANALKNHKHSIPSECNRFTELTWLFHTCINIHMMYRIKHSLCGLYLHSSPLPGSSRSRSVIHSQSFIMSLISHRLSTR